MPRTVRSDDRNAVVTRVIEDRGAGAEGLEKRNRDRQTRSGWPALRLAVGLWQAHDRVLQRDSECLREPQKRQDRHVVLRPFDTTDVGPVRKCSNTRHCVSRILSRIACIRFITPYSTMIQKTGRRFDSPRLQFLSAYFTSTYDSKNPITGTISGTHIPGSQQFTGPKG